MEADQRDGQGDPPGLNEDDRDRLYGVLNGFVHFQVAVAGYETGLFALLCSRGRATLDEIQSATGLPRLSLRTLLLVACDAGLVRRDSALRAYEPTAITPLLVADRPGNVVDYLRFSHLLVYRGLFHFTESVKAGTNIGLDSLPGAGSTIYERIADDPSLGSVFHTMMSTASTRTSPARAEADVFAGVTHLLDLGGGDGATAAALVAAHPDLRVTIIDLPSVTERAEHRIAALGLERCVAAVPGDFIRDGVPRGLGADAILLSHAAELFSPEQVIGLIADAHEALPPGGHLLFWSVVANDEETGGPVATRGAAYYLAIATGTGYPYPVAELESWFESGGFDVVEVVVVDGAHALVAGRRRA